MMRTLFLRYFSWTTRSISSFQLQPVQISNNEIRAINLNTEGLLDKFQRKHQYLRISLTEKCNLRCTYCMPKEGVQLNPKDELLKLDEILRLATIFANHGVKKIRLTGGEPTLRKDLVTIVEKLSEIPGIEHVGMTTNGIMLGKKIDALAKAGLKSVNISLDTLVPEKFFQLTRRKGFGEVLKALDVAANILTSVKINCVVMKGFNDDEIIDFVSLSQNQCLDIRFIEYMPFTGNKYDTALLVTYKELLKKLDQKYPLIIKLKDPPNSTSKSFQVLGFKGKFGFISSMTENFCVSCDRLRLTADGNLKVCLHANIEISLKNIIRSGGTDDDVRVAIISALQKKKLQHPGPLI